MALNGKRIFTVKSFDPFLYQWSPQTSVQDVRPDFGKEGGFCTAIAYSQGKDLISTYSDGRDSGYVECDYWN
jgi:hypothetical protein